MTTPPDTPRKSLALPLLLWMFLQLIALLLAAAHVPLSANSVEPAKLVVYEMLVVQFVAAGMLFPYLLPDVRANLVMMIAAALLLALAASRSGTPIVRCVGAWTCLGIWLTGLTLCAMATTSRHRLRSSIIAIANLFSAGGLIFWYLASEFGGSFAIARYFPLVATLRFAGGRESFVAPLISTLACLFAGWIVMRISKWGRRPTV